MPELGSVRLGQEMEAAARPRLALGEGPGSRDGSALPGARAEDVLGGERMQFFVGQGEQFPQCHEGLMPSGTGPHDRPFTLVTDSLHWQRAYLRRRRPRLLRG